MPVNKTCQICGREIKAKSGLIAHHGYQRPGQGWQTASCFGARWRPYEVACDALPPAIKSATQYRDQQKVALKTLRTNPPATFTLQDRDAYGSPRGLPKIVSRPEGFDGMGEKPCSSTYRTYEWKFWADHYDLTRRIKGTDYDIKTMTKRLNDWVAP